MAAQRKTSPDPGDPIEQAPPPAAAPSARKPSSDRSGDPAAAEGVEATVNSPAHALQARLIAEYSEPDADKWSPRVRAAIIFGSATLLWVILGGALVQLLK